MRNPVDKLKVASRDPRLMGLWRNQLHEEANRRVKDNRRKDGEIALRECQQINLMVEKVFRQSSDASSAVECKETLKSDSRWHARGKTRLPIELGCGAGKAAFSTPCQS